MTELDKKKNIYSLLLDTLLYIEGIPEKHLDDSADFAGHMMTWRELKEKIKVMISNLGREVRY